MDHRCCALSSPPLMPGQPCRPTLNGAVPRGVGATVARSPMSWSPSGTSARAAGSRRPSKTRQLRAARDVRRLREFSTFDKFSDHELQRLVRTARHESRSTPWPLIHERTPSDACCAAHRRGGVYVGRDLIATLGPGEVIGESAIRSGKLRSATVTTTGPAEALRIDRDDLAALLDELPALREAMDATIARHTSPSRRRRAGEPEPKRTRLTASVPAELATRFEQAAGRAG